MELLPFAFEESVFEDEEGGGAPRAGGPLASPYSARCCEPEMIVPILANLNKLGSNAVVIDHDVEIKAGCSEWFCEQVDCQDDLERINIKKFRGDLAYKKQDFQKALQEYSSCFALVPSSNIAMRRDLKESQARCLAHLGKHEEALRIAENLKNGATNTDHVTAVLNLQYVIYRLLEDIENVIGCLQKLISLHPFHPQTWNLLAETYLSLLPFPVPLSSATKAHLWQSDGLIAGSCLRVSSKEISIVCHQTQSPRKDDPLSCTIHTNNSFGPCMELQSVQGPVGTLENSGPRPTMKRASLGERRLKDMCVYACASFVRARLLFQLTQLTQSSFALENNLKMQREIEDKIRFFELEADTSSLMTEVMGEDLVPEKLKGDAQEEVKCFSAAAFPSILTVSTVEFERKWFQKLQGCFHRMDCPT